MILDRASRPWPTRTIGGTASHNERYEESLSAETTAALTDLRDLLADGSWHRASEARAIARRHGLDFESFIETSTWRLELAESDSGRWLALPGRQTPEAAPDEEISSERV